MVSSACTPPPLPASPQRWRFPVIASAWSNGAVRWRSKSGVWQQIRHQSHLLPVGSQQPNTPPSSHKAPSPSEPCPWHAKMGRQAHPRDKLLVAYVKTFWWGFGGEELSSDFVKESKWGVNQCRSCSPFLCVWLAPESLISMHRSLLSPALMLHSGLSG